MESRYSQFVIEKSAAQTVRAAIRQGLVAACIEHESAPGAPALTIDETVDTVMEALARRDVAWAVSYLASLRAVPPALLLAMSEGPLDRALPRQGG